MFFKKKNTFETKALKYMKQKYQEDFTPGIYTPGNYKHAYNNLTVFSENFPNDEIDVYEGKKGAFEDTYPHVFFKKSVEDLMNEIAKPLFQQCTCYLNGCTIPADPSITMKSSLEEYLKASSLSLSVNIYINELDTINDYNELSSQLEKKFKEKNLPREIALCYLQPNVTLTQINRSINQKIVDGENPKQYIKSFTSIIII